MLPISYVAPGDACVVKRLTGNDKVRARLAGMGFVEGAELIVIGSAGGGNLIVKVADSRVALDSSLCRRIMVQPREACRTSEETSESFTEEGEVYDQSASDFHWQFSKSH